MFFQRASLPFNCVCLSGSGDKSTGWPAEEAVRVEQEGGATVSHFPDRPERRQSCLQRVPSNERWLPQLHGDYCCSHLQLKRKHKAEQILLVALFFLFKSFELKQQFFIQKLKTQDVHKL